MTKVSSLPEGSSFTPRQVRLLKVSIAVMTALLILGVLALVYGMVRQASKLGVTAKTTAALAGQGPYIQSLVLGQGELKGVTVSDGLIVLNWQGSTNEIVVIIDAKNGHELGRIQVLRN